MTNQSIEISIDDLEHWVSMGWLVIISVHSELHEDRIEKMVAYRFTDTCPECIRRFFDKELA